MYIAYCCAGIAAIAAVYSLGTSAEAPSEPPMAIVRETPSFADAQFADRSNIERAILDSRASLRASVIKVSLRSQRRDMPVYEETDRIAAAVQTELQRHGCYSGRIDNLWGGGSRRAMAKFNRSASLNLNESAPGSATLASLQGIGAPVCGPVQAFKEAVASRHVMLSANPAEKSEVIAPADRQGPPASYLPPWTKKSIQDRTDTTNAALANTPDRNLRKVKKATQEPRAVKLAAKHRPAFSKDVFGFAWPGE